MKTKAAEFLAEMFAVRTGAHILHLQADSYAEHMALGSFYEAIPGLIDSFAETYQGLHGLIKQYPEPDSSCQDCTGVELMEYVLDAVSEAHDYDSPALENILAEIEQLAAQTLYKLRFLK